MLRIKQLAISNQKLAKILVPSSCFLVSEPTQGGEL